MIRAVLFDLDDTLYPEGQFYRSGFAVVADWLADRGAGRRERIARTLDELHFNGGREHVFDRAATVLGFPSQWVPELVWLFHSHLPQLELPASTIHVLGELCPHYRLGIVTDGHGAVQRRKLDALRLWGRVDGTVITDDLGRRYWKPSPVPFVSCCRSLRTRPHEAVFVGDNPRRDILGARRAGLFAVRLRRADGYFRDDEDLPEAPPHATISNLMELPSLLANWESIRTEAQVDGEHLAENLPLV